MSTYLIQFPFKRLCFAHNLQKEEEEEEGGGDSGESDNGVHEGDDGFQSLFSVTRINDSRANRER